MYEAVSTWLFSILTIFVTNMSFMVVSVQRQLVDLGTSRAKNNQIKEKILLAKPSLYSSSKSQTEDAETGIAVVDRVEPSPFDQDTKYVEVRPTIPWGTTEKLAEHTYRTYVGEDEIMSSVEELHNALNKYRANHGVQELFVSDQLCRIADFRIAQLDAIDGLDAHKGFKEYLSDGKNWENIPRFVSVGENNSYGYKLSGTHLIEWVFDADEEHRSNQMNPKWNRVCSRISGTIVEIIFGEEK